jgi:hypothetical protein
MQFSIYPVAGEPVRWNIVTASDSSTGIMCNDPEDFAAKILGECLWLHVSIAFRTVNLSVFIVGCRGVAC